jgi:hypothetical protein
MEIPLPIIAALTAALVSGGFSVITHIVVSRNDKRKRREEARLRHLQRQIEDLYGPLYGLIQFGAAINEVEWLRLPKECRDEKGWPRDEQGGKALQFFREHYYLPLNEQIIELIRTKVYLLNSDGIPDSFAKFIKHAAQLDSLHRLWKEADISTPFEETKVIEYPMEFRSEVQSTLNKLRKEYNEYIASMKGGRRLHQQNEIRRFPS